MYDKVGGAVWHMYRAVLCWVREMMILGGGSEEPFSDGGIANGR